MFQTTLLALALALGAAPQASGVAANAATRAEATYPELVKEYEAAVKEWRDTLRALAKTDKAKADELEKQHPAAAFWPRFEALGATDGRALLWMLEEGDKLPASKADATAKKSALVAQLLEKHASEAWAGTDLVRALARQRIWFDEAWVREKLAALADASKSKEVSAAALSALIGRLSGKNATPEEVERAKALTTRLETDFAGTAAATALKEKNSGAKYEKGGVPDDFEATDTDGVKFKLSDYRGKVVMLDFWGFW